MVNFSLSESTGAANIFGNSGGVMEAALRTAYYLVTNEEAPSKFLEFREVRGLQLCYLDCNKSFLVL